MTWICELVVTGDVRMRSSLDDWKSSAGPTLKEIEGLTALDFYEPTSEESRDPYNHDGAGPLLIAILDFADEQRLRAALEHSSFAAALRSLPAELALAVSVFEREFYAIDDSTPLGLQSAPISYVVRYHRPASDEALFIKNYVDSHPPTQAKLPGIRAIACYFPRPHVAAPEWEGHDYLVGNEVVFDSVEDFNAAMASPVRQELRAHYHDFPTFTGENTHYLMRRTRVAG